MGPSSPAGVSWIGTATSPDGVHWRKHGAPVLSPQEPWEKQALQCPNVVFDAASGLFQMWYSGGDQYEPDAVGFATSADGVQWTRHAGNPIFAPSGGWEDDKIGSFQVRRVGGWYYAFYNAFQHAPFVSRIGMARSPDGVTNWERHPANPIISVGQRGSWDAAMVYKPTALWDAQRGRWDVWFNASQRLNHEERIGHAWSEGIW
jgi:beta-1,2-mannobiose phosphorylase / 1,2-beta-oligomannan phosphorylase